MNDIIRAIAWVVIAGLLPTALKIEGWKAVALTFTILILSSVVSVDITYQ